jgi:hypothetical protein
MKRLLIVVVAAAIVGSLAPQAHSIGAFFSYWNGKDTDNGYGLGVNYNIKIIPLVDAEIRASWLSFSDDDPGMNLYPLEGLARFKLGLFYLGAGVGYYVFSGSDDVKWDNAWGVFGVGGAGISIAKIGIFGELKYTWVETKITEPAPAAGDVDGSGIGINVGVTFGWI